MKFQNSQKLVTKASQEQIFSILEEQFGKVSEHVEKMPNVLVVKDVQATFGSINRNDITRVSIKPKDGRYTLVSETEYTPSRWFWIFFGLGLLFSLIGSIVPVVFYLWQKEIVKKTIDDVFRRVEDELDEQPANGGSEIGLTGQISSRTPTAANDELSQIERLGQLMRDGIITKEEFDAKKRQLLGLDNKTDRSLAAPIALNAMQNEQTIFVRRNGKVNGPFQLEQAKQALRTGRLLSSDEISIANDGPWQPADNLF
jgi:hypothetical protein